MNKKYERVSSALERGEQPSMKAFGKSMTPLIKDGSVLTYRATGDYRVGDVVFAQVGGKVIAAHKITKIGSHGRFLIANNKGRENGWASRVWGRVVAVNGRPFGRSA